MDIKQLNERLDKILNEKEELSNNKEDKWLKHIQKVEDYLKINYDYIKMTYEKVDNNAYNINIDTQGEGGFNVRFECKGDTVYSYMNLENWVPNNGHVLFDLLAEHLMILSKIELILKGVSNTSLENRVHFPN